MTKSDENKALEKQRKETETKAKATDEKANAEKAETEARAAEKSKAVDAKAEDDSQEKIVADKATTQKKGEAEKAISNADNVHEEEFSTPPDVFTWVALMNSVPLSNVKGAGSTQENRCKAGEINAIVRATSSVYGIAEPTALTAICELVRRGGANASTPDSFTVELKCVGQGQLAFVSKGEISNLVARLANGKSMRNLAEGLAETIVRFGVDLVRRTPGLDRPGDLAKKVGNRLSYKKQQPLTPSERVGCASYAQWLPNLDQLVGSDRLKSLLAEDLELRKQGRVLPQPRKNEGKESSNSEKKTDQKAKGKNKAKKGQGSKKKKG